MPPKARKPSQRETLSLGTKKFELLTPLSSLQRSPKRRHGQTQQQKRRHGSKLLQLRGHLHLIKQQKIEPSDQLADC